MSRPDPARLLAVARAAGLTLGSAESLTGGAVSVAMSAVPGASDVWRGAIVAYSADVKRDVLAVPQSVLDDVGAVSPDTALAMAHGARRQLKVDFTVATTGVAGPEPHAGRQVGTVVIAVVGPGTARVQEYQFAGDREAVVHSTVDAALAMLMAALGGAEESPPGTREQV